MVSMATIPAHENECRFDFCVAQLLTTLERRPANTKTIASLFGATSAGPASPPPLASAAERAYLADEYAEDARATETAFWQAALASVSPPKQDGPFSAAWRAPRSLAAARAQSSAQSNAVLFGGKRAKHDDEPEARAAAVASKHRKLAENSAAIAAQPRRGAANHVPASSKSAAAPAAPDIRRFLKRVQP